MRNRGVFLIMLAFVFVPHPLGATVRTVGPALIARVNNAVPVDLNPAYNQRIRHQTFLVTADEGKQIVANARAAAHGDANALTALTPLNDATIEGNSIPNYNVETIGDATVKNQAKAFRRSAAYQQFLIDMGEGNESLPLDNSGWAIENPTVWGMSFRNLFVELFKPEYKELLTETKKNDWIGVNTFIFGGLPSKILYKARQGAINLGGSPLSPGLKAIKMFPELMEQLKEARLAFQPMGGVAAPQFANIGEAILETGKSALDVAIALENPEAKNAHALSIASDVALPLIYAAQGTENFENVFGALDDELTAQVLERIEKRKAEPRPEPEEEKKHGEG